MTMLGRYILTIPKESLVFKLAEQLKHGDNTRPKYVKENSFSFPHWHLGSLASPNPHHWDFHFCVRIFFLLSYLSPFGANTEDGYMIRKWSAEHGQALHSKPKILVTFEAYLSATIGPNISDWFDLWLHWVSVVREVKKKRESLASWALPAKSFLAKFPWEIWILLQTAVYSCFHAGFLLYSALFAVYWWFFWWSCYPLGYRVQSFNYIFLTFELKS